MRGLQPLSVSMSRAQRGMNQNRLALLGAPWPSAERLATADVEGGRCGFKPGEEARRRVKRASGTSEGSILFAEGTVSEVQRGFGRGSPTVGCDYLFNAFRNLHNAERESERGFC